MSGLRLLNAAEQVVEHLRAELISGRLQGTMPGVLRLEASLGVNRNTLEAGLRLLEEEGLLIPRGAGRRRRIVLPARIKHPSLRIAILLGESADRKRNHVVEFQHELDKAGHTGFHTAETMAALHMDVKRIARMVRKTKADAWVVLAGSYEVLEWFSKQAKPVFALFGRRRRLPIAGAGPNTPPAFAAATRALIEHGHRHIVLLTRAVRRIPSPMPGSPEYAFLRELKIHGIPTSPYNLPDWEETTDGFHARLESLFRVSPPTALIIEQAPFFVAAQQFLARHGIRVPEDVSLICTDASPDFERCLPAISHIHWDTRAVVRRILHWAENVSRGRGDTKQTDSRAEFITGGTIGPVAR